MLKPEMMMVPMIGGGMRAMKIRRRGRIAVMVTGIMMMRMELSKIEVAVVMVAVVMMRMVSREDTRLTVG